MSLKETYTIAHTAQCKLHMAVNKPDRNWRFIVGHAVTLDNVMLRLVQMEESIDKAPLASDVRFKGAGGVPKSSPLSQQTNQRKGRSPPLPQRTESGSDDDDEEEELAEYDDEAGEDLNLMRFPSGSERPPMHPPPLDPSDEDSSSDDEEEELTKMLEGMDFEKLKSATEGKGNQEMVDVFNRVQGCPCHGKPQSQPIENFWELPGTEHGDGVRTAVVEIRA
ncbi:hypothetical protein EJ08DRAFT_652757 [Tothia fuscella]|uniref:Uncharacterized protein n=1 Tax=Tothia fuscella TaxID=1048955 RepID=A0A9P4TV65_9PEZI|nr:hypothetical protein EJ08DRAFT_652757 [Tothia fuscella]